VMGESSRNIDDLERRYPLTRSPWPEK